MANYIYVMKDGKIVEHGEVEKIFNSPNHRYTKELILSQTKQKNNNIVSKEEILKVQDLDVWYPIKKGLLKRTIDYVKAINNISFSLKKGESIGIVGESGSGKTSLILAILKLINSHSLQHYLLINHLFQIFFFQYNLDLLQSYSIHQLTFDHHTKYFL